MPIPVSVTAKAITASARFSDSLSALQPLRRPASPAQRRPCRLGELEGVGEQVFSTCCRRVASVQIVCGSVAASSIVKSRPFVLGDLRGTSARRRRAGPSKRHRADVDRHGAGLDLGQVEDVVDQRQQVVARGVDRAGELDLLRRSGCRRRSRRAAGERISRLFSGVRSSWDMLARNCDLYLEVSASCSAFSSSPAGRSIWRSSLDSRLAGSPFSTSSLLLQLVLLRLLAPELARLLLQSRLSPSSCCWLCSSWVSDCDCFSSSSVRMFAAMRVEHDADALGELVEERQVDLAEAVEGGQLDDRLDLALEEHRQHDDVAAAAPRRARS